MLASSIDRGDVNLPSEKQHRSSDGDGIAKRSLAALKWNYLGAVAKIVSQFAIGIALARLLGPEPFGVVAIAWVVIGFGYVVSEMGFGMAIVQHARIDEHDVRHVFTVLCIVAVTFALVVAGTAGWVAAYFHKPEAAPVIRVLSLYFVLQSAGQVSQSLLKRNLDFRAIQKTQVVSYLFGYLVLAVPMAYLGYGVWSLVTAVLVQAAVSSIMLYAAAPHSIRPRLGASAHGLNEFGLKVMGTNVVNQATASVDAIVIGQAFGTVPLGLYNRTFQLFFAPMLTFVSTLTGVLMPAYSRGQNDLQSARRGYGASVSMVAVLCAPPLLAAACVPQTVILGLFGERWSDASPLVTPIALAAILTALTAVGSPLINGLGRPGSDLRAQGLTALIMTAAMLVAMRYSVSIVAWTVVGVYVVRFALMFREVARVSGVEASRVFESLYGPTLITVGVAGVVLMTDLAVAPAIGKSTMRLALDILSGLGALIVFVLTCRRYLVTPDIAWLLARVEDRLPRSAVALLSASRRGHRQ